MAFDWEGGGFFSEGRREAETEAGRHLPDLQSGFGYFDRMGADFPGVVDSEGNPVAGDTSVEAMQRAAEQAESEYQEYQRERAGRMGRAAGRIADFITRALGPIGGGINMISDVVTGKTLAQHVADQVAKGITEKEAFRSAVRSSNLSDDQKVRLDGELDNLPDQMTTLPQTYQPTGATTATGGGSGDYDTTTQTYKYDSAYESKMADLAERQMAIAEEQWDQYKTHYQEYELASAQANKDLLPYITDTAKKLYTEALAGVDPKKRADEAGANVVSAIQSEKGAAGRTMSRYGIDPGSSRFKAGIDETGVPAAGMIAGARNRAVADTERENFTRLGSALGLRGYAETDAPPLVGMAQTGLSRASSSYAPLATRVLETSRTYPKAKEPEKASFWDFAGSALGRYAGSYAAGAGYNAGSGYRAGIQEPASPSYDSGSWKNFEGW